MIILPDRKLSRGKVLMPVPRREWMPPSRAQQKTFCGDEDRTRFRLRAKTHDGRMVWQGWFEDRDDADAFLFALVSGSLRYERGLWQLPTPAWHPGIGEELSYDFVTQTILTTTGSNQTYTKPADWNNADNTVECIGAGGSGGVGSRLGTATTALGSGGGGGGYGVYTNLTLSGNATYRCGTGGTSVNRTTTGVTAGVAGGDTWFGVGATSYASASVGGTGGGAGNGNNQATSGSATGGTAGAGKGTANAAGGAGGDITVTNTNRYGSGGGGAGGPNGAGNAGVSYSGTSAGNSNGGSGDAGSGGSAGVAPGGAGGNGTEWTTHGCGGGGAGSSTTTVAVAGSGGNYGGGGGGAGAGSTGNTGDVTSGAGTQGIIIIEYTPASFRSLYNMPMIGM